MKRILFIEPSGQLWGSEQSLALLINHVDPNQFTPVVLAPSSSPFVQLLKHPKLEIIAGPIDNLHKKAFSKKLIDYISLFKLIKNSKVDIIHLNQSGLSRMISLIAKILQLPLCIHVRLHQEADLVRKSYQINPNLQCIAISEFVANELRKNEVPSTRITTITDPIDLPNAEQTEIKEKTSLPDHTEENAIVGFVGRLTPDKGIECFIEAANLVFQKYPHVQFWIVGSDGDCLSPEGLPYERVWKQKVEELEAKDTIHFLGFRKDVTSIMQSFTMQITPSIAEPWGRVTAEAMNGGVAVIASDSGASRELIEDKKSGLLFAAQDEKSLAKRIEILLNDQTQRKLLAEEGRKKIQNAITPTLHSATVEHLYRTLFT